MSTAKVESVKISLGNFLRSDNLTANPIAKPLIALIENISQSCQMISKAVNQGALDNILGSAGSGNIQGETQQKLDILANDMLIQANESSGLLAAMASEEMESIHLVPNRYPQGEYLLLFDPLDGSANLDVGGNVGTIFSIFEVPPGGEQVLQRFQRHERSGHAVRANTVDGVGVHNHSFAGLGSGN